MWRSIGVLFFSLCGSCLRFGCVALSNKDVYDFLCGVTRNTSFLLSAHNDNPDIKKFLEEAIYGPRSGARFTEAGTLELSSCGWSPRNGRGPFCTYKTGDASRIGEDGCFAKSLVGTLLCICSPGKAEDGLTNLCGAAISHYSGESWSGRFIGGINKSLLKKVWEKVIQGCTKGNENVQRGLVELKMFGDSVDKVRDALKEGKISRTKYSYLGEDIGSAGCSGENGADICAAYQKIGNNAYIPWVNKIKAALPKLEEAERTKTEALQAAKLSTTHGPGVSGRNSTLIPIHRVPQLQNVQTEVVPLETKEKAKEQKVTIEATARTRNSTDFPKSEKKISSSSITTVDTPYLATDVNEDGSFLNRQTWLLLIAVFN